MLSTHFLFGILISAAIVWSWYVLTRRGALNRAEAALCAGSLGLFQISTSSAALALGGMLYANYVLALNLLCAGLVLLGAVLSRSSAALEQSGDFETKSDEAEIRLLNSALLLLLAIILVACVLFGASFWDISTDGLWLHLPSVFLMQQEHTLIPTDFAFISAYPKSVHLWYLWVATALGERWIDLGQIPFLLLFSLAAGTLARCVGVEGAKARLAGLLACFAPLLIAQLVTSHIDLAVSALLLIAVATLMRWFQTNRSCYGFAFLAALTLLLGAKYSTLLQVAVVLSVFTIGAMWRWGAFAALPRVIASTVLVLICGGYQYAINFARYANPLYPYRFKLGEHSFAGPLEFDQIWVSAQSAELSYAEKIWRSWSAVGEAGYGYLYGGLGILWPIFLLCILACFVLSLFKDRRMLAFIALFALLFAVTPLNFSARFALFLFAFGSICTLYLCNYLSSGFLRTVLLLCLCAGCVFVVQQELKYLRSRLALTGESLALACQRSGFPESDREIFSFLARSDAAKIPQLTVVPSWEPYALSCLFVAGHKRTIALLDPSAELKALPARGFVLVSKGSRLFSEEGQQLLHGYQLMMQSSNSVLMRPIERSRDD